MCGGKNKPRMHSSPGRLITVFNFHVFINVSSEQCSHSVPPLRSFSKLRVRCPRELPSRGSVGSGP